VSQNVAKALAAQGINARYLEGGIETWTQQEGPLDRKPAGADYALGHARASQDRPDRVSRG
jgi:hypothetical protein